MPLCIGLSFIMAKKKKNNTRTDAKTRAVLFSRVKLITGDKSAIKLGKAIEIYTLHHNIEYNKATPKVWLYNESKLWEETAPKKTPRVKKETSSVTTKPKLIFGVNFYMQKPWRELRAKAIKAYGCTCMRCGYRNTKNHVDHIYPRSKYPHLELEFCNLQVLCETCNSDKSNTVIYDMRPPTAKKWQDELKTKVKGFYHQPKLATN